MSRAPRQFPPLLEARDANEQWKHSAGQLLHLLLGVGCVSPFTFLVLPFDTDLSVIKAGGGCGRKLAEPCLPHSAGTGDSLVTFVTLLHNCGGRIHNITGRGPGTGAGDQEIFKQ